MVSSGPCQGDLQICQIESNQENKDVSLHCHVLHTQKLFMKKQTRDLEDGMVDFPSQRPLQLPVVSLMEGIQHISFP